ALGVTGAGQVWVSADPAAQPDATAALDTLSADALIPAEPVLLDVTGATTTDVARLSFDVNGALQLDALPADEASMLFLPILTLTASGTDGAPLNLGIGFDPVTGAFGLTRQIIRLG